VTAGVNLRDTSVTFPLVALLACTGSVDGGIDDVPDAPPGSADAREADARVAGECPAGMLRVGSACMDVYEAPNVAGALPLVMYTFDEAERWCGARGKRLCFDDEWTVACAGAAGWAYPYGATRVAGTCNDAKTWILYDQSLLNGWPAAASRTDIDTLAELWTVARAVGPAATAAADHVEALYQAEGGGAFTGCVGEAGVFDLVGSVEEWTRRRDGGERDFHGNLKGRYWAESRTCQQGVRTHGDGFRFYEIGFRCCVDR